MEPLPRRRQISVVVLTTTVCISALSAQGQPAQSPKTPVDTMVSDYLLVASLSMRPNTQDSQRRSLIQNQLASLHQKYNLTADSIRDVFFAPDGVAMIAQEDVFAFRSTEWFDPLAVVYGRRGTLPVMEFRGEYGVGLTGEAYVVRVLDGAMIRTGNDSFTFQGGKWAQEANDARLAASGWELGFPPTGCAWQCQRDDGCQEGGGRYTKGTEVVAGAPKKPEDGWARVCR